MYLIFTGRESHYSGVETVSYFVTRNNELHSKFYSKKAIRF